MAIRSNHRLSPKAAVVGSGPNGLAAAIRLADAGCEVDLYEQSDTIGGGLRSAEVTVDGLIHDLCSAVHPLGVASPYFGTLGLERFGLEWAHPRYPLVHPIDGGAAVMERGVVQTAAGLADGGAAWRRLYGPIVRHLDSVLDNFLHPLVRVPRHPATWASVGALSVLPARSLAGMLGDQPTRALFAGIAAHSIWPLERPGTAGIGLVLGALGQRSGWPVVVGGSQRLADALTARLESSGGRVHRACAIDRPEQVDEADLVLLDIAPDSAARLYGDHLPSAVRRSLLRWKFGPGAFKLDLAVEGGIPWASEAATEAGTVHVGGTVAEIAEAERAVARGRMPERPFVLVAQPAVADPSRALGSTVPIWAYAHVPSGYAGDATEAILSQIDRFAPGIRDRILAAHHAGPPAIERRNPNFVGGDIATGRNSLKQLVLRPRLSPNPYSLGINGVYLCSASTPPGAGVHGMCGMNAATEALRWACQAGFDVGGAPPPSVLDD